MPRPSFADVCLVMFGVFSIGHTYKGRNYVMPGLAKKTSPLPDVSITIDIDMDTDEDALANIASHPNWALLDNDQCGENYKSRIVGGHDAQLGEHPWIVRLGRYNISDGFTGEVHWFCGGSLLNKHYIVTAAHCTKETNFRVVRLGEYDLNSVIDCNGEGVCAPLPVDRIPLHIKSHEGYKETNPTTPNDISLVLLSEPVEYSDYITPICLPTESLSEFHSGMAEVIGWGLTVPLTASVPSILKSVNVPIVQYEECTSKYYPKLHKGTLCAGTVMEDSCNGDSGGPLMKKSDYTGSPKYYMIGVVSFGPKKCGTGDPGGYTNVTYHLPWILDNIKPI